MKDVKMSKVYILPNLFTTMNLFCGFYAIIAILQGNFLLGSLAIFAAGLFDILDGRIARLTGTTSQFGAEYDSLCDLVSFGLAPALLVHQWALHPFGRYGWLAAFLYVATTALRLARYNTTSSSQNTFSFVGLPCPAAAFMIASSYQFCQLVHIPHIFEEGVMLAMVYLLSYLMVSSHKYPSCKKTETMRVKTFHGLVFMVLVMIVVAMEPQIMLFGLCLCYIISAPMRSLILFRRHDIQKVQKDLD